jgi:hypothetical protein
VILPSHAWKELNPFSHSNGRNSVLRPYFFKEYRAIYLTAYEEKNGFNITKNVTDMVSGAPGRSPTLGVPIYLFP